LILLRNKKAVRTNVQKKIRASKLGLHSMQPYEDQVPMDDPTEEEEYYEDEEYEEYEDYDAPQIGDTIMTATEV
jgi:hypothetical protein